MKPTRLLVTLLVLLTWEFIASDNARGASLIWTNQSGTFSDGSNWSDSGSKLCSIISTQE